MQEPVAYPPEFLPHHPFGFHPSPLKETYHSDFQQLKFLKLLCFKRHIFTYVELKGMKIAFAVYFASIHTLQATILIFPLSFCRILFHLLNK